MFHVKHFLLFLFFLNSLLSAEGQGGLILEDKPFVYEHKTDSSIWKELSSQPDFILLNTEEQKFFYWTNLFRSKPKWFYENAVQPFLTQFPEANTSEAQSLRIELLSATPLVRLLPDRGVIMMAKKHAIELRSANRGISHTSPSGKGFMERMKEAGSYTCGAENLYAGTHDPLMALILLLLDHGVIGLGHRRNLMDTSVQLMGVSFIADEGNRSILVQVMACR